jgi:DNA-directed RNA polymerase specialized sigma24 family protein
MSPETAGSVTGWIDHLREGDDVAARRLWERYFHELVHLARARLRAKPRGAFDEEDIALSAFESFCRGAEQGRFPRLDDRDGLWRLLVTITARKVVDQVERQCRRKRGGGRVRNEAALAGPESEAGGGGLDQAVGREPTPEFAAMMADECRHLLAELGDEGLRQVALLRMEGYSDDEIASRLDCSVRTVGRKLRLIRDIWMQKGMP